MKKIILALILGSLSTLSFGVELCSGGTAVKKPVAADAAPDPGEEDERFIKTSFSFNCSNNSIVVYTEQGPTLLTVGATSLKGSEYFGGHTDGGAVKSYGPCNAKDCVLADAENGDDEAKTEAEAAAEAGGGDE